MSGYLSKPFSTIRSFSRDVHLYNLSWFFIGFAFFGIGGVLSNLYLLRLGFDLSLIGQVSGIGQLVWAALALPASLLGMRFGMRNTVIAGSAITAAAYILFLFASYLPLDLQIPGIFISNALIFGSAALVVVCGLPYLSSVTCPEERSQAMALNGVMTAGAGVLGSLAAGFLPGWLAGLTHTSLDEVLPYRLSLALIPGLTFMAAFVQSRMRPDEDAVVETPTSSPRAVPLAILLFFGLIVFLQTASEGGVRTFYNVYLDQDLSISTAAIGTLFGIGGVVSVFGNLLMPALVRRFGSYGAFGVVSVAGALSLTFIGGLPKFTSASTGYIIFCLVYAIGGAVRNVLSQEIVQPRWRSATSAILVIGYALGWASMALLGSSIIIRWRFGSLMYISAVSATLSVVVVFSYLRWIKSRLKDQPTTAEII